jgi:hypothetical protein
MTGIMDAANARKRKRLATPARVGTSLFVSLIGVRLLIRGSVETYPEITGNLSFFVKRHARALLIMN